MLEDAYKANKNLPEEFFEGLNEFSNIPTSQLKKINGAAHKDGKYGANINTVRELLKSSPDGLSKQSILDNFPDVEGDKYQIVTNAMTALRLKDEIEKYKPKGKKMKGYYWRMKT